MLRGLSIGYVAIAVFASCGLLINVLVANTYGAAGLGIFAQIFAIYLVFGQLVTGSLHLSILKDAATHSDDRRSINAIVATSLSVAVLITLPAVLALWFLAKPISLMLDSEGLTGNIQLISASLLPFALNKILLGILNGLSRVGVYHACQITKYLVLTLIILLLCVFGGAIEHIAAAFIISESIALLVILFNYRRILSGKYFRTDAQWFKRFLGYLREGYASSFYPEVNLRVDLIMIGVFLSDTAVGIYSISSAIYEGVATLLAVFRVSVNPKLARMLHDKKLREVMALIRNTAYKVYPSMLLLVALSAVFYEQVIAFVFEDASILLSYYPTHILLVCSFLVCGLIPFNHLFLHIGEIRTFATTQRNVFLVNVVLNIILINAYGVEGAAAATGISLILGEIYWFRKFLKLL